MTPWAAKVLEGVDKYTDIHTTDDLPVVFLDEVIAALARMGAGDGLVERLNRADEYEPLGHDGWEAAARIAALTAQNREMALDVLASSGQAQEAYAAQLTAEAEAATLRAKLARIASAWPIVRDADCSGGTLASAMDEIEAAISDGAADGGKHE